VLRYQHATTSGAGGPVTGVGKSSTSDQETAAYVYLGSFVTDKPFPRDLDIFLLMQEGFDREFAVLLPPPRSVFDHEGALLIFEADIFWATETIGAAVLASWLSIYQFSRDMEQRCIVEVIFDD
jgi:hypothetical protein